MPKSKRTKQGKLFGWVIDFGKGHHDGPQVLYSTFKVVVTDGMSMGANFEDLF